MARIVILALLATGLHAQNGVKPAEKLPAKAEQALRARAEQFYQDFVKGQFGDAESLVAPETKDYFISIRKERYISCEVKEIGYAGKSKLGEVRAECLRTIVVMGFVGRQVNSSIGSTWKLVHGKWCWYVDPDAPRMTPFGNMGTIVPRTGAGQTATAGAFPTQADVTNAAVALNKVSADKRSLAVKVGEAGVVAFSNAALGTMSISLDGDPPEGIEATPTHADMPANGKATVSVKALEGAKSAVLKFRVFPTGESIAIRVDIQQPAP